MADVSRRIPWRNGGGWTAVLAQAPDGEPAEWRISVAEIERDGPFSDYSGYDRTIVAEDAGFTLDFADGERVEVEPLVPFSFAGERAVHCRLRGPRASAFNVMTLRDAFTHDVCVENGEIEVRLTDVLSDGPAADRTFASFEEWEHERRRFASWETLVKLRFAQNVHDERAAAACAAHARLAPIAQRRDAAMKRRFLEPKERVALEPRLGAQAFARWGRDVLAFDPAMAQHVARELELCEAYTRLTAGATFTFLGERHTAASLGAFARNQDRAIRREANARIWGFYETHSAALDKIYGDLVRTRTAMARDLGYASYTDLAYVRLGRTDYGRGQVQTLREEIAKHVVPLCAQIAERQAGDLGVEAVMPWDELVFEGGASLPGAGPPSKTQEVLARVFDSVHPALGAFAQVLIDRRLFDLEARPGKRSGAFCSFFPAAGLPHVFANFTGTPADVMSLVHETGHAFQDYSSRRHCVLEYIVPTA
ncbi:MAG TPA: HutD family protein, partial [Candidatus Baltobacteraceae bacterium]|nr:HutD family protein [Candidatus Baltobacteraceae bacterium]